MQLADKYRPGALEEIAGNAKALAILRALVAKPFPSAWLLEGPSGIGKTSAALAVAKALASGMDIAQVNGQDIGAADVRRLFEGLHHSAWKPGGWKIVIVDEADRISHQGQQLWLSYLEALPPHAIVIFTSNEKGDFEPRFLSRVKVLHFTGQGMADAGAKRLETVAKAEGFPLEHGTAIRLMRDAGNNVRIGTSKRPPSSRRIEPEGGIGENGGSVKGTVAGRAGCRGGKSLVKDFIGR